MSIEVALYLLIASVCITVSQMLSGQDNGAFYAKGLWKETGGNIIHPNPKLLNELITPVVENMHRNETPSWYSRFGAYFFLLLTVLRYHHNFNHHLFVCIVAALLMTMGCSAMANKTYQCFINVGSGLPCVDPHEGKISEFALGKISIRWRRPFSGKGRVISQYLGIAAVLIGFLLGFIFFK